MQHDPPCRSTRVRRCVLRMSLAATVTLAGAFPSLAAPDSNGFVPGEKVILDHWDRNSLARELAGQPADADTLPTGAARGIVTKLFDTERTCRTGLMSKEEEPGSPWLTWRSLARVDQDSIPFYIGSVSCVDTLCGPNLVRHDRLAILCLGRTEWTLNIYPRQAPAMDDGHAEIDSVRVYRAPDHLLLMVHRKGDTLHPCYDGPEYGSWEEAWFALVRGGAIRQVFRIDLGSDASSHDDVDGDSGTMRAAWLTASADSVHMRFEVEDWQEAAGTDTSTTRTIRESGTIRFAFEPDSARFVRLP